jgi:hypothetical protein
MIDRSWIVPVGDRVMPRTWEQAEEGQGFYALNRQIVLTQPFHYKDSFTAEEAEVLWFVLHPFAVKICYKISVT